MNRAFLTRTQQVAPFEVEMESVSIDRSVPLTWRRRIVSGLMFAFYIWASCTLYTYYALPQTFKNRASWFLQKNEARYLGEELSSHVRMVMACYSSLHIVATVFLGLCFNTSSKPSAQQQPPQPARATAHICGANCSKQSVLCSLAANYVMVAVASITITIVMYAWCSYCFLSETGYIWTFASAYFKTPTAFARVSAGFTTSVFLLSYLDPFHARKTIGVTPPQMFAGKEILGLFAISGLGGLGGVGSVVFCILSDVHVFFTDAARGVEGILVSFIFLLGVVLTMCLFLNVRSKMCASILLYAFCMPLTEMVLERDFVDMDTIDKWITPGILLLLGFLYHIFGETEEDVAILTSALNHSALHRRPRTLSTSVCLKKESGYPHTTHFQAIEFELPSVRHMFTAMLIGLFVTVSIFDFASFVL